jgi:hypothetical protein
MIDRRRIAIRSMPKDWSRWSKAADTAAARSRRRVNRVPAIASVLAWMQDADGIPPQNPECRFIF